MFELLQQNEELKAAISAMARPLDFDSLCARPTHGYFSRVIEREAQELKALRHSLAGFGYYTE